MSRRVFLFALLAVGVLLTACGGGISYEVDLSGVPAEMAVGDESILRTYVTMYSDGEVVYDRAPVQPENVTYSVQVPAVAKVETRTTSFGSTEKVLVALAAGSTAVTATVDKGTATNFVTVE